MAKILIMCWVLVGTFGAHSASAHPANMFQARAATSNYFDGQAGVSSRQAAAAARSKVGGRVISVKPYKNGNGYRVRLLVDGGRVITVRVDGKGRVLDS